MTPDLATFRALFPELAAVPDAAVQVWLDDTLDTLDAGAWGLCYAKAVLFLTAHALSLSQQRVAGASTSAGGAVVVPTGGQVQTATAEGLTVSFAVTARAKSAAQELLAQTPYGLAYSALQRQCLSRGRLSW